MNINPYQPPQAPVYDIAVEASGSSVAQDVTVSELTAFAGDSKYPERWAARHGNRARLAGFNIWAAIFGIQWFFFRKLYFQGLLSIFLEVGVPVLFAIAIVAAIGKGQPAIALVVFAGLATRVAIGYWANLALYHAAVSAIRSVDRLNLDNEAHLKQIAKAGGVSVPSLIAAYVLFGALRFAYPHVW